MRPPALTPLQPAPLVPLVARVSVFALARFRRLMACEGWAVDLARMCCDRIYAYECIAQAHTSATEGLRRLALDLFAAYDPHAEAALLH